MVEPVQMRVPRRRDHVWDTGDNLVAALATSVIDNAGPAKEFESSLAELKTMVPDDAATASWTGSDGIGIRLKVSSNNAKRWEIIGVRQEPHATQVRINPRAKQKVAE